MKKKGFPKRFICIFLCAAMVVAPCTVFASAERPETVAGRDCVSQYDPIIYVYGFGYDLCKLDETGRVKTAWKPDAGLIASGLEKLVLPTFRFMFTHDYNGFAVALSEAVDMMTADIRCDDDGNPINGTVFAQKPVAVSSYAPGDRISFYLDWRLDVWDNAEKLSDFIGEVKASTGRDTVALDSESMGTSVVMSYLERYGTDSVSAVVLRSSAFNGITFFDRLMTGEIDIDNDAVVRYIGAFIQGDDLSDRMLRTLLNTAGKAALYPVSRFLDTLFTQAHDEMFKTVYGLIGNMPGMWSFLTDEGYEQAKAAVLDETVNRKLIEKIDRFHDKVRPNIKTLLTEAMSDGVNVALISNYGLQGVPVMSEPYQSDFLIDTKLTSCGAVCADLGGTLGGGYVQRINDGHNHLSPDGVIDASTCMFPEYTWFVRGMVHTWYNVGYNALANRIIYSESQPDVFTSDSYPQFMVNRYSENTIALLR